MPGVKRLPRSVWLDSTVKIEIHYDPPAVIAAGFNKNAGGYWDAENHAIHIDRTLSNQRKWKVLRHELVHACIDTDTAIEGI